MRSCIHPRPLWVPMIPFFVKWRRRTIKCIDDVAIFPWNHFFHSPMSRTNVGMQLSWRSLLKLIPYFECEHFFHILNFGLSKLTQRKKYFKLYACKLIGFFQLCLDEMGYNIEKVINAVLEEKLPPSLLEIDRKLPR